MATVHLVPWDELAKELHHQGSDRGWRYLQAIQDLLNRIIDLEKRIAELEAWRCRSE